MDALRRCPVTGKISYPSETEAVGPDTTVGIYFCAICEGWHRTRGVKWPGSVERADAVRESARRRESFGASPLAQRLGPDTVEKLRKISEAN